MSWKEVFNGSLVRWGHISECHLAAKRTGYEFYTWNGWVYSVDPEGRTDVMEEELN